MGWHVITRNLAEGRGRFASCYSDYEFERLPYIKEYGYLPSGYSATHLDSLDGPKAEAVRALPEIEAPGYPYRLTGYIALKWELEARLEREWIEAHRGEIDPILGTVIGAEGAD